MDPRVWVQPPYHTTKGQAALAYPGKDSAHWLLCSSQQCGPEKPHTVLSLSECIRSTLFFLMATAFNPCSPKCSHLRNPKGKLMPPRTWLIPTVLFHSTSQLRDLLSLETCLSHILTPSVGAGSFFPLRDYFLPVKSPAFTMCLYPSLARQTTESSLSVCLGWPKHFHSQKILLSS